MIHHRRQKREAGGNGQCSAELNTSTIWVFRQLMLRLRNDFRSYEDDMKESSDIFGYSLRHTSERNSEKKTCTIMTRYESKLLLLSSCVVQHRVSLGTATRRQPRNVRQKVKNEASNMNVNEQRTTNGEVERFFFCKSIVITFRRMFSNELFFPLL